jgi:3'(2'), 5'-bisphosphate nucleotidase
MNHLFLVEELIKIVTLAGDKIMEVYHNEALFNEIEQKADNSPLTLADRLANQIIVENLQKRVPHIPIISEEGKNIPFEERKNWHTFWLVDPLDGTKEFIKRNGQFTVNISLIENGVPTIGIIQMPVSGNIYYAHSNHSFKTIDGKHEEIKVNHKKNNLIAIGSSSHASETENTFLGNFDIAAQIKAGSSMKFCYVAEGKADIYYREGPTMEWDTAAGHAIVAGAGGNVEGLRYNKENLLNGSFCCYGF